MAQESKKNIFAVIFKSNTLKMMVALSAVCVISSVILVYVYDYSIPKIEINIKEETKKAIETIFPDLDKVENVEGDKIFRVIDASGNLLGYAFLAEGSGYQGTIKLVAGIDSGLSSLKGIEILESQETPGLGDEIKSDKFRGQFNGLDATGTIEYVKNQKPSKPCQIEAITGATISSRAVVNALNKAVAEVKEALKDKNVQGI